MLVVDCLVMQRRCLQDLTLVRLQLGLEDSIFHNDFAKSLASLTKALLSSNFPKHHAQPMQKAYSPRDPHGIYD